MGLLLKISIVLIAFAGQIDCAQQIVNKPTAENRMENTESNNLPKLEVSLNSTETTLEVEYKIKNNTNSAIYLFNVLLDPDAVDKVAPYSFYSCLRADKTLILAKMIPKLPSIAAVEFREIPYVTKVEAGKEFSRKETVSIPVEEFSPYFPKGENSKVEIRTSERALFTIQFIREKEGLEVKGTNIPDAYSVWHKDLFGSVETITSKEKMISVKVNKRLDAFEEF